MYCGMHKKGERMLQKKTIVRRPVTRTVTRPASSNVLDIKQSTGKVSIYKTAWCIIGPPGVGKTTLASGFEGALHLVTSEKEVGRLNVPYILIDSWEKLLTITDELVNNRQKYEQYKFLVIDFVDAVWTMCSIATCEKLGVAHYTDAQWGKGADTLDNYFKKWVTTLIASDYGIVFISHVNQKDVIVQGGTVTKTICTLPPRARLVLFPLINVIGCMEYKSVKVPRSDGKTVIQRQRVMLFEATEYVEAKDRDGVLPKEIPLVKDPQANFQMFCEYYDEKRKKT
jgi:energy-coupling factor transporter ATP-binding protein EcfA2